MPQKSQINEYSDKLQNFTGLQLDFFIHILRVHNNIDLANPKSVR